MEALLMELWDALGPGDPPVAPPAPAVDGARLASPLSVGELACAAVACALLAAAELSAARGRPLQAVSLDPAHVGAAFRSERAARLDGQPVGAAFDELSAFVPAADGWVRLHANYPHHRAALCAALGLAAGAEVLAVREAVAVRRAVEVEEAVVAAGGCAAAVREEAAWRAHPHAAALAPGPLGAEPGARAAAPLPPLAAGVLPATGVRILDLTRVIAGPVGTRWLAALGAEVLRVDPPWLDELPSQVLDGGPGKRSTRLDLAAAADRARLEALLEGADVLVSGYRPGALAAFGLDPAAVARRHPRVTTVTLSAWGGPGPWAGRRGFDSLVQAATGIATASPSPGGGAPGALPAQALDHATGYLVAAAALRGLARRAREGRALHAQLALARTARTLLALPRLPWPRAPERPPDPAPHLQRLRSPLGDVALVRPPGRLDGRPLGWSRGPVALGADPPGWAS